MRRTMSGFAGSNKQKKPGVHGTGIMDMTNHKASEVSAGIRHHGNILYYYYYYYYYCYYYYYFNNIISMYIVCHKQFT